MFHGDSLISGGVGSSQKLGAHVAPQGRCWLAKPQLLGTCILCTLIFCSPKGNSWDASWHVGELGTNPLQALWPPPPQGVHLPLHLPKSLCTRLPSWPLGSSILWTLASSACVWSTEQQRERHIPAFPLPVHFPTFSEPVRCRKSSQPLLFRL